jgi:phytoene synthase
MADHPDIAAFARAHDPDRFLCALFAPAARRGPLFALIGLNHELARAREAATNPIAALIRLQWWREVVEEAAAGRPPRRHEVALPLHAAIASGALDPRDLLAMADAREAEAEEGGIPTRAAFDAYLRGTAGGFAVAAGRLLGASGEALVRLQSLGAAYGLAGVLRSVPHHAAAGRCLLPGDALAEAGALARGVGRGARRRGAGHPRAGATGAERLAGAQASPPIPPARSRPRCRRCSRARPAAPRGGREVRRRAFRRPRRSSGGAARRATRGAELRILARRTGRRARADAPSGRAWRQRPPPRRGEQGAGHAAQPSAARRFEDAGRHSPPCKLAGRTARAALSKPAAPCSPSPFGATTFDAGAA